MGKAWYADYNVAAGVGVGTIASPCRLYDLLDGNTTVPNGGGTISSNDWIVIGFDPADIAGTAHVLGSAENLATPVQNLGIVGGDRTNSFARTDAKPLIDASGLSSGVGLYINDLWCKCEGFRIEGAPSHGVAFGSSGDRSVLHAVESHNNGGDGIYNNGGAYSVGVHYCKTDGNAGWGIYNISSDAVTLYSHEASDNTVGNIANRGSACPTLRCIGIVVDGEKNFEVNSDAGATLDCTAIHLGTGAGTTYGFISGGVGNIHSRNIAVSMGTGTSRFSYPANLGGSATGTTAENNISFNNINDEALGASSIAYYQAMDTTNPEMPGGTPFDATPAGLSGLEDFMRVPVISGEATELVPGAVQPGSDGGAGPTKGIISNGMWR